ncbi:MAG: hypothetical protein KBT07_08140 [Clostridiales bacterium]|nr:hypothetical protein [Candidatus Scatonaster coprocaballi]
MLEKYPYNDEFEAWEVTEKIFDEELKVLVQAQDEETFIRRVADFRERIAWLNNQAQAICDVLDASEYTEDGDARVELRPAEIAVTRCYAEMTDDGIALDLIVAIVATGIEKEVSMFADEFGNIEVLGEIKSDTDAEE